MSASRPAAVAPEAFETERLLLRRPRSGDARQIFARYASDVEVTRYLAWPRHTGLDDTRVFLGFSDAEWARWGSGPYLAFTRADERLVGSTGLAFERRQEASTGYLVTRDSWGMGYATEMLRAMVVLAQAMGVVRLYAICHVEHTASQRVMEKCGLVREGVLRRHLTFPNLGPDRADVLCYARTFG
jgi:RimJ/RimL family protein N-acetyltransferase